MPAVDGLGHHRRLFRPGRAGRRASSAGSSSGPVNAVLGWFFRGFNRLFDRITEVYGWTVGRRAAARAWSCCSSTAACWC